MNRLINIIVLCVLTLFSCDDASRKTEQPRPVNRVFEGFHPLLDEIIKSKQGVFRGLDLNASSEQIMVKESADPAESTEDHLYYEYEIDSVTNYSIDYSLANDSLTEINLQINTRDLDLSSYIFCDLKDYYANKLPNPTEDQGYVVYNCFEGQRKPFVVSLSDNSSTAMGIINMVIYKDN